LPVVAPAGVVDHDRVGEPEDVGAGAGGAALVLGVEVGGRDGPRVPGGSRWIFARSRPEIVMLVSWKSLTISDGPWSASPECLMTLPPGSTRIDVTPVSVTVAPPAMVKVTVFQFMCRFDDGMPQSSARAGTSYP
jgi:hypothetical protein